MATRHQKVIALAAGNRHTAAIIEGGTVLAWGSNEHGQLGYGTTDSASNATPRIVEAMKVRINLRQLCPPFPPFPLARRQILHMLQGSEMSALIPSEPRDWARLIHSRSCRHGTTAPLFIVSLLPRLMCLLVGESLS